MVPATIGSLHHKIRTTKPETQMLFDQGLTFFYGFNRTAARRSFERAAILDPTAAMPHVGIALAAGPNLNTESTPADVKLACAAAQRATTLAQTPEEKGYAHAVRERFCAGITFNTATGYAIAMGELYQRYPEDPDAATLYAESLLVLRPRSAEQNVELVAVLEEVLSRWPGHVGANHYYIHAVEGSTRPERALASAGRLESLLPAIGHLLHMPAHIYSRMGDYARAIQANERAVAADLEYLRANGVDEEQLMYYHHDLESLAVAAGLGGRFTVAHRAGASAVAPRATGQAPARHSSHPVFSPILGFVLLRFARWEEVLALPAPPSESPSALWHHFTRSVASAKRNDVATAILERDRFQRLARAAPTNALFRQNPVASVIEVASAILDARVSDARGERPTAIVDWQRAVAAQDRLVYHEPPAIYYPVRESLGAALYQAGRMAEAESVFRDDLLRHPRSGRSLYGLWQTLAALGRRHDAEATKGAFEKAWAGSDVTLSLSDF
jgi:tetratricopeptide (TPR) repeat protein